MLPVYVVFEGGKRKGRRLGGNLALLSSSAASKHVPGRPRCADGMPVRDGAADVAGSARNVIGG